MAEWQPTRPWSNQTKIIVFFAACFYAIGITLLINLLAGPQHDRLATHTECVYTTDQKGIVRPQLTCFEVVDDDGT